MFFPTRDRFKQTPDGGSALSGLRVVLFEHLVWLAHFEKRTSRIVLLKNKLWQTRFVIDLLDNYLIFLLDQLNLLFSN